MSDRVPWLVVDAMNVIGSRPDGWWHDRAGAVRDLVADVRAAVDALADHVTIVVDGRGTEQSADGSGVEVRYAPGGPDAADHRIVEFVEAADTPAVVITGDRRLRDRVTALGARVHGPSWLRGATDPTNEGARPG